MHDDNNATVTPGMGATDDEAVKPMEEQTEGETSEEVKPDADSTDSDDSDKSEDDDSDDTDETDEVEGGEQTPETQNPV